MTFLQQSFLFALPLIALPILIHLINQNRYKTINWAATMFLLQAKKMARGMARLRYILILIARMLAIAGLIFAVSRPMAGGWLGLTNSGAPDLTMIILDRSVSMEEQDPRTGVSKRETALEKLSAAFRDLGRNTRIVLFDSATGNRHDLSESSALAELPETSASSTAADIPAMLQSAAEYLEANESGRTDVWICSDLRQNDWSPGSGRWESVRKVLGERQGTRIYLLAYEQNIQENLAISVSGIHRRETLEGAELVMDIKVTRAAPTDTAVRVPLTFVINGARSTLDLELTGAQLVRNGHTIPIDRESRRGWGRVELPRDANSSDNLWNFVYAEPAVQKSVIVSEEGEVANFLKIAASTPSDRSLVYQAEVIPPANVESIVWDQTATVFWNAPLPQGAVAELIDAFVRKGGCVMFFPPESPDESAIFGYRWGQWQEPQESENFAVLRWRTDEDLLGNTLSGTPLPVGQLAVYRACELMGDTGTALAQLNAGPPLLLRANTDHGAVWFCSSLPSSEHSNFVSNGIAFYVMVQRAIARGAAALGSARQYPCGSLAENAGDLWKPLDEDSARVLVSQRTLSNGLYSDGDVSLALNRPLSEDLGETITDDTLSQLMSGLNLTRINDQAGSSMALATEVWRTFLIAMIIALLAEALLCVPDRQVAKKPLTSGNPGRPN
ncbi:MAG: BatA domain-containing protein [Planctomycetaceae bacterium]